MKDEMFAVQPAANNALTLRDPAAVAAAESAKARIQAAYIMAVQKPRSEEQARQRILAACRRPEFARRVEYAKPIAKTKITGPSVRFAELALREWGNIDSDIYVVFEDDRSKRVKIRLLDCETNAAFSKEITINKTVERRSNTDRVVVGQRTNTQGEVVYIVLATEDELLNKENALISKALRNEGLRLIPSDIIDEAITTARQTQYDQDAKDPASAKKAITDSFASIGVMPLELEKYLRHKLDTVSPAELADLRSIYRAIKDGESTWSDYVDLATTAAAKAESKLDELKEKIKGGGGGRSKQEPPPPPPVAEEPKKEEPQAPPPQKGKKRPTQPELPLGEPGGDSQGEEGIVGQGEKEPAYEEPPTPRDELTTLNTEIKQLISANSIKVKAALINAKMPPKTDSFKTVEEGRRFFASYKSLMKK